VIAVMEKIYTERLVLDEISLRDTQSIFNLFSLPEVVRYYDLEAFENEEQAEKLIKLLETRQQDGVGIRWAIRFADDEECIGTCGFNSWNKRFKSTVIGYDLHKKHWGKGLVTEALGAIIDHAFSSKLVCGEINRIQADTMVDNIASERVLAKLAFEYEGIHRQAAYWKDEFHDLKCYSLLKEEHNKSRALA